MKKILLIILMLPVIALADGIGGLGYNRPMTYHHQFPIDSAVAICTYKAAADTIWLIPITGREAAEPSEFVLDSNAVLDSAGLYLVTGYVYLGGSVIDTFIGTFWNQGAFSATLPDSVLEVIYGLASPSGDGPYQISVYARTGLSYLTGVAFRFQNIIGSPSYYNKTKGGGYANFAVDTGSFYIIGDLANYGQTTIPETVHVIGDTTLYVDFLPFAIIGNTPPGVCLVWGNVYNLTGQALKNCVATFQLESDSAVVKYGNIFISKGEVAATSDTTGLFYIKRIPNSLLNDTLSTYLIRIKASGITIFEAYREVPDSSVWEIQ